MKKGTCPADQLKPWQPLRIPSTVQAAPVAYLFVKALRDAIVRVPIKFLSSNTLNFANLN